MVNIFYSCPCLQFSSSLYLNIVYTIYETIFSADKATSDIGKVPSVFHSSSFNLSDIEIFNKVFPWEDIQASKSQSKRLLQEQVR